MKQRQSDPACPNLTFKYAPWEITTTECSLGLQWTAGCIHKIRTGSAHSFSNSPVPPPTLKMFCTCSSLKSVPEFGQHKCSQFALLSLYTTFLSNFVFCGVWLSMRLLPALTQTQPLSEDMVSMGSPLKRWLSSMWWVLQGPEMGWCPPCFPDHCPFLFRKVKPSRWPTSILKAHRDYYEWPPLLRKSPTTLLGSPELAPTWLHLSPSMHWSLSPGTCTPR